MIDLHCHILPGLDDGAGSADISCQMAAMAAAEGTTHIVCTPHCSTADPDLAARCGRIRRDTGLLAGLLQRRQVPVALQPGMELLCAGGLERVLATGPALTLAGSRYLLVEFDFDAPLAAIADALHTVERYGMVPLLAHPERYFAVQRSPGALAEWFARGYGIQVNKGSLLGRFGPGPEQAADWILSRGLAHVVASDAHGARLRTTRMAAARDAIAARYAPEYAEILLLRNPRRILQDRPLLRPEDVSPIYE